MPDLSSETNVDNETSGRWRRILLSRWLLSGVAAVVLYALCGFLLTPWLLKRYVGTYATEKLNRQASVTEVRLNPFLFTLTAREFSFQEADGRPIVGFESLFVDFELSSLFRWAWTFAAIRIEQPSLHVEIQRDGRLNFAALSDEFPKSEEPPPADSLPPRLLVKHAEVIGGSLTFSDLSDSTPASETFSPLNLEFREISTLPERKGPYTVRAELPGGGTVGWRGEISVHPIFSEGELSMTGFKLATAWKFAQDELRLSEPSGEMDISTRYRFDYRDSTLLLLIEDANVSLKDLSLSEKENSTPLLALEAIEAKRMRFDLQAREFVVPSILIRDGMIVATVDEDGLSNWQKLVRPGESADAARQDPDPSEPESQPLIVKAEAVKVENVAVRLTDRSRANPLELSIGGLNVALIASAKVGTEPPEAIVDDLEVVLNRVSLSEPGDDAPLLSLDAIALNDGRIDIGDRSITTALVEFSGGGTSLVRGTDGRIRLMDLLDPGDKGRMKRDLSEAADQALAEGKPWSFSLDHLRLKAFQIALQDHTFDPAIVYDLEGIHASLENLTNDGQTPIDFETKLNIAQGGSATVSGQMAQSGDRVDVSATVSRINLKPLHPALTKYTVLALESGDFSATANLKYGAEKSGESDPQLRANGSLSVNDFLLSEEGTGERFLEWRALSAKGIEFGLSPRRLHIEDVRLQEPGAKVVIFEDRSINLAKVLKHPEGAKERAEPQPEGASAAAPGKDQGPLPLSIERVRVKAGVVDFADFGLVLPFATQVTDFHGGVTGIASDSESRTSVAFEGIVGEYGHTTVEGGMSPFAPKEFTDITVLFRNIELKPLSPYSATFASRKIASGSLNLKLEYKIQSSELLGDHEVVLEQFTLGERVEAPDAMRLPLDLAVAILTDTEGKIDLAVPVRGNVDDPEFKYGHVIRQAVVNLITKLVTAPFRALGGLVGDKGEPIDAIAFYPGSDRLPPPERKKFEKVVEALKNRPQLRLVVQGRFDPEVDGEALRTRGVRLALAAQMGMKLGPDEDPGPLAFDNAKTQKALEALLKERDGEEAIADFEEQYEKNTGREAKRVKPYLAAFGRGSSDTGFYQAMFEELVKLEPMPENDLEDLARRRAQAIVEETGKIGGFDATRVAAGTAGPVEEVSTETVKTKLALDVVQPASL